MHCVPSFLHYVPSFLSKSIKNHAKYLNLLKIALSLHPSNKTVVPIQQLQLTTFEASGTP